MFADPYAAARWMAAMLGIGEFVIGSQLLANRRLFERGQWLDWEFTRGISPLPFFAIHIRHFGASVVGWICLARSAAALLLIAAAVRGSSMLIPLAVLIAMAAILRFRAPWTETGADQLSRQLSMALLLGLLGSERAMAAALVFIAALVCLAYVTSGVSKGMMVDWRSGGYLRDVLRTRSFGSPFFARWTERSPGTFRVLAVVVIALEVSFPLWIIAPPGLAAGGVLAMLGFHVAVAAAMGLNVFLLTFPASYPAVLFVNHWWNR